MTGKSFFGILGTGTNRQETQFSRTFLACFEGSGFFRQQILHQLFTLCRIRTRGYEDARWECAVEVPTPIAGGGRMDIRLTLTGATRVKSPVFYLESKLESALTLEQLGRYRKHGVDYMIAVTKYSPEVTPNEARSAGVFTLRWQDIHHCLLHARPPTQRDRFLIQSLLVYMEELGMAYREDLTIKDLETCRRLLTIISNHDREYSPRNRNGFELSAACLGLLEDVWRGLVEVHPTLTRYHRWGPGYFNWIDENGARWHAFGWNAWKRKYEEEDLAFRIELPEAATEPFLWKVERRRARLAYRSSQRSVKRMLSDEGKISQRSLVRWLGSCVTRWRLV